MLATLPIHPLTEEEYARLRKMPTPRKLCARHVKRAQIILLSNQDDLLTEIGQKLVVHERNIRRWIGRFNRLGIVGLEEGPWASLPRVYSSQEVGIVIQTALTPHSSIEKSAPMAIMAAVRSSPITLANSASSMGEWLRREGNQPRSQNR
jgi:transposase